MTTVVKTGGGGVTVTVTGGAAQRIVLDRSTVAKIHDARAPLSVRQSVTPIKAVVSNTDVKVGGVAGVQGPRGIAGDSTLIVDLSPSAVSFPVAHSMGKFPSVDVVDSAGSLVDCAVAYVDNDNITISSSSPFSGTAYLN